MAVLDREELLKARGGLARLARQRSLEPEGAHIGWRNGPRLGKRPNGGIQTAIDIDIVSVMRNQRGEQKQIFVVRMAFQRQIEKADIRAETVGHLLARYRVPPVGRPGTGKWLKALRVVEGGQHRVFLRECTQVNGADPSEGQRGKEDRAKEKSQPYGCAMPHKQLHLGGE